MQSHKNVRNRLYLYDKLSCIEIYIITCFVECFSDKDTFHEYCIDMSGGVTARIIANWLKYETSNTGLQKAGEIESYVAWWELRKNHSSPWKNRERGAVPDKTLL